MPPMPSALAPPAAHDALDAAACYAALLARDARFDGHWFTAVTSTGVYCRPVCRVRTPLARNCRFFRHAAAAEAAGFRPCMKCRPELAPGSFTTMDASRSLAAAARERLDQAALHGATGLIAGLSRQLGITERHLRRIFEAEFGVAPMAYVQTRRLLTAKQLLTDTPLSVAQVAQQAGFASTRTFQQAWGRHYGLAPSKLRKRSRVDAPGTATAPARLWLAYRPPLAQADLLAFLAARAVPSVERVDPASGTVHRSLRWAGRSGSLRVRFDPSQPRLSLALSPALWDVAASLLPALRRWLDLDADPLVIAEHLQALAPVAGLRLPGCLDRFELAVRAVLGQQVSVAAARTLATRLVERFGETLPSGERLIEAEPGSVPTLLFPTPEALTRAGAEALAACGMPAARARTLAQLAQHWPSLRLAEGRGSLEEAEAELLRLPGIGPWTASYILMRAWPWPDRFLPGDVVLRKQLAARPGLDPERFAPYRSYAVLNLWRQSA
jgi:AraC family transcriptional regulator of adaptative response / DNA-3-methyladenine glycosylase II